MNTYTKVIAILLIFAFKAVLANESKFDVSVTPENIDLTIDNVPIQVKDNTGKRVRPHIGVNLITEDLNNEWVYFAPMHGLAY